MRISKRNKERVQYSLFILDDDQSMVLALKSYFDATGYDVEVETNPIKAIEIIKKKHFDILLLDFLMTPINGAQVVSQIREFNQDLYIILLTGHKDLVPPVKTIRELDIQGYYEKSERFDQLELLVESCVKSIKQMQQIRKYKEGLTDILNDLPAIYRSQSLEECSDIVLKQFMQLVSSENALICIENIENHTFFKGVGVFNLDKEQFIKNYSELALYMDEAKYNGKICVHHGYIVCPLRLNELSFGVLLIQSNDSEDINMKLQLFEVYTKQAVSGLQTVLLNELLEQKNKKLEETYFELKCNHLQTTSTLRLIVDAKDIYTRGHSDRVSFYATKIAKKLGKDSAYIQRIALAGLFHDIGKIGVPDSILISTQKLTKHEYEVIKKHSQLGFDMLNEMAFMKDIAKYVLHHHERYDGKGYPYQLQGEEIPEESRILAVADAFDAMNSDRHYRHKLAFEDIIKELENGKWEQFDGDIVNCFIEVLKENQSFANEIAWTYKEIGRKDHYMYREESHYGK